MPKPRNLEEIRYQLGESHFYIVPVAPRGFEIHQKIGDQYNFLYYYTSLESCFRDACNIFTLDKTQKFKGQTKADLNNLAAEYASALQAFTQFYERMRQPLLQFQEAIKANSGNES